MIVALTALGVALLVPAAVALVLRPQRGILLLAALVPFNGLLLLAPPHPAVVDGWKEALVAVTLAATFLAPASARGAAGRRLPDWWPAAAGLLVVSAVSAVAVGGVQGALGLKIGFYYLLVVAVLWRCPFDEFDRDLLVTILMATGLLTALLGLAQQVLGAEWLVQIGYEYNTTVRTSSGFLRSFSTFNLPFPFGLFLTVVALVCLPVALSQPRRPRNAVFLIASPVLAAGLISSTVRAALLGLAVGICFLAVHRHRGLVHLVAPLLIGALFVPSSVTSALLSAESLGERRTGWSETLGNVLRAPLGEGIGATGSAAAKSVQGYERGDTLVSPVIGSPFPYQPDNQYVKVLLELGPLGLWLLVLLLAAAFVTARQVALEATGADAALAAGIATAVLAAAAASLVSTYLEIFPMDVYFWLLLGVLSSIPHASSSTRSRSDPGAEVSRPTSAS